jgi:hypothetical protein
MMRSNFSSAVYGGGALRSSVERAIVRGSYGACMHMVPLRLAPLTSSPVNGGGKPPARG